MQNEYLNISKIRYFRYFAISHCKYINKESIGIPEVYLWIFHHPSNFVAASLYVCRESLYDVKAFIRCKYSCKIQKEKLQSARFCIIPPFHIADHEEWT